MPPRHQIDEMAEKRLERVGRFCAIIGVAWLSFGILYAFRGVWFTTSICVVETIAAFTAARLAERKPNSRRWIANGCLGFSMAGIIVESLGSGLSASTTPLFLCCVGLMAAHQTGIRSALGWTLAIIFAQLLIYVGLDPAMFPVYRHGISIEKFLVPAGVTLIIYGLSHQAEWSFDRYAKHYIEASEKLRHQAQSLGLAERVAKVGHWQWRANTNTLAMSKEAIFICGFDNTTDQSYTEEEFIHSLTPESARDLQSALNVSRRVRHEFTLDLEFKPGNATQFAKCTGFSEVDSHSNVTHIFGVLKDETEAYKAQFELNEQAEALRNLAQFDQLSGLANRRTFRTQLAAAAFDADANGKQVALLLIDLDGFKEINDTMGHAAGDAVLRDVANRFLEVVDEIHSTASVARLGGDEFTIIINEISDQSDIERVSDLISQALSEPFEIESTRLRLGASIGSAVYPTDTADLTELLSFSDTAMYEAKLNKTGLCRYDAKMTEKIVERRNIEARLQSALKKKEFFFDYQPLFTASGKVSGVEALMRWIHEGKIISPTVFIPHLEASQAIHEVGRWALFESCNQARTWLDAGTPVRVSVNISSVQFRQNDFVRDVCEALTASYLPPELLDIEITESVIVERLGSELKTIHALKEIGVHLSIDDFGTGYSSLAYLKHLPFDRLKIDRAFVKDFPMSDDGTLAKTIIVLAHGLNLQVVAEGVETKDQYEFLRNQNCDEFQGYLLSKPVSANAITTLINERPVANIATSVLDTTEIISLPDSIQQG